MKSFRSTATRAFTLIELLMVIAIIAIVAGLVVGLSAVAGEKKKVSRTQAELHQLITLIENYKSKVGVFPPDNRQTPFRPERNSLFYELAGAKRNVPANGYTTAFGVVLTADLQNAFGIDGIINASDDPTDVKHVLKQIKPDQVASIAPNTKSLVVPVDGPNGQPNPWRYAAGTNAVHNPETFDLWVQIVARGKTNTIGNWKE